jgi:signal transduction histidine kinase
VEGDLDGVPATVMDAATSVIREGFANAAKHALPGEVDVRVRASRGEIEVTVRDDGRGFRPEETGSGVGHLGLEMMRRRVAEVNGTLDVRSAPGRGTRLVARLPLIAQGAGP